MIIDTQTHYLADDLSPLLSAWEALAGGVIAGAPEKSTAAYQKMRDLDRRLDIMDRIGIDVSVLSPAPLGVCHDQSLANEFAAAANDSLIAACKMLGNRFVALGRLPLPDIKASLDEAQRLEGSSCIRGFSIPAQTMLYKPDEPGLEQLFRFAAQRNWVIVIHPPAGVCDISALFADYGLSSGLHAMTGSLIVLARLIFSGVLDRVPDLDVIATHLGGGAPFFAERLDSRGRGADASFSEYLRSRVYLDNCGFAHKRTLQYAQEIVGEGRIVIGSDWPSRPIEDCLSPVEGLPANQRAAILGGTAQRWFKPAVA